MNVHEILTKFCLFWGRGALDHCKINIEIHIRLTDQTEKKKNYQVWNHKCHVFLSHPSGHDGTHTSRWGWTQQNIWWVVKVFWDTKTRIENLVHL